MRIEFSQYYQPKAKQRLAHGCRAKFLLFAGAFGAGKSWFLCAEAIKNALMFEGNRLVIVRKELSVMRRTILVTFFSVCPPKIIRAFNQSTMEVTFVNGSVLTFIEANVAKDPLLNKLKGLEIGWFGIDEGNEVSEEVFRILKTRLRWVLTNGKRPRYEGRLTSNPENCWLIPAFIQSTDPEQTFIQSITTDNYAEDDEYVLNLKNAFKDSPNLYRKYLLGDWTNLDSINQLISNRSISNGAKILSNGFGTSMGIDVARFGGDKTVFTVLQDGNVVLVEDYSETTTNEVVTRAIALMEEYKITPDWVGVDAVGIGAGVVDNLRANGYHVQEIQGGAKPIELQTEEAFKPHNLRAQMYWELKRDIDKGNIGGIIHPTLKHELSIIRYEIMADKTVKILSKEALKKLLGKSPDFADSLVYANWVKTHRGEYKGALPFMVGGTIIGKYQGI